MTLEVVQLLGRHLADGVHADAFEHVDHGHVTALEAAGQQERALLRSEYWLSIHYPALSSQIHRMPTGFHALPIRDAFFAAAYDT